jgi:tetratricopeptide (TPR) repeat protein
MLIFCLIFVTVYITNLSTQEDLSPNLRTQFFKCLEEKDFLKAENILKDVLEKNPNDPSALDLLGNLHFMKGNIKKSLELYNKAISVAPKYAHTYYDRGSLYLNLEEYDKALKDMYKAVELDPNYAEFRMALGATLFSLNEIDKAEEHLEKAIQLDPTLTEARFWLGVLYLQLEKEELAFQQLSWILENDPDSFEAQQIRSFIE